MKRLTSVVSAAAGTQATPVNIQPRTLLLTTGSAVGHSSAALALDVPLEANDDGALNMGDGFGDSGNSGPGTFVCLSRRATTLAKNEIL